MRLCGLKLLHSEEVVQPVSAWKRNVKMCVYVSDIFVNENENRNENY